MAGLAGGVAVTGGVAVAVVAGGVAVATVGFVAGVAATDVAMSSADFGGAEQAVASRSTASNRGAVIDLGMTRLGPRHDSASSANPRKPLQSSSARTCGAVAGGSSTSVPTRASG